MANPILQALLVADHIYEDKQTGKKIVAGIFRNIIRVATDQIQKQTVDQSTGREVTLVPGGMQPGSPYVYVSVTEVLGEQAFLLRYVRLHDDQALFQTEFVIKCDSPLETCELVLPLPRLPTSETGVFALELLCGDEPLGSFRISVSDMTRDGENENDNN